MPLGEPRSVVLRLCFSPLVTLAILLACAPEQGTDPETSARTTPVYRLTVVAGVPYHQWVEDAVELELDLREGQALRATVDQERGNVELRLESPTSQRLVVDLPVARAGPELLCYVATARGPHQLTLRRVEPGSGSRFATELEIEVADDADRACARTMALLAEAEKALAATDLQTAAALLDEALETASTAGEPMLDAAVQWQRAEVARQQGDFKTALLASDSALAKIVGFGLPALESYWLYRQGRWQLQDGRYRAARERLELALDRARSVSDRAGEALALHGLGMLAQDQADLPGALAAYETALGLWRELDRPIDQAATLARLASVSSSRSQLAEARDLLIEALEILPPEEISTRVNVWVQMGWVHFLAKEPEQALGCYEQAWGLLAPSTPPSSRAGILDRMASAERQRGRFEEASRLYGEALALLEGNQGAWRAHVIVNLGELYLEWGRLEEARQQLDESARLFKLYDDDNALAHTLASLARLERRLGHLQRALELLEQAVTLSEALWRRGLEQGDLGRPTALLQDIDALHVDLLMALAVQDRKASFEQRAFVRSDFARDRNLLALIHRWLAPTAPPASEPRENERQLVEQIELLEQQRGIAAADPAVERQIRLKQRELEAMRREERSQSFAGGAAPTPLDAAVLRADLPDRACVLSYALGEPSSHLFLMCPEGLTSRPLPSRSILERQAERLAAALAASSQQRAREQVRLMLAEVAQTLLGPVADRLQSLDRLTVVPEGALLYIPFAALPGSDGEALLSRLQVTQGPSVGVLAALRARAAVRAPRPRQIVVVADPVYSATDPRCRDCRSPPVAPSARPARARGWMRLPGTLEEGRTIAALGPGETRLLLGLEASRQTVLGGLLKAATIIHLAAHGHMDEEVPSSSGIALSQLDHEGVVQEGFLRIRDIQSLDLTAELVVLSACRSAWGKPVRGDGLVGMAGAFFAAGASRVIVSLWEVDDDATAQLMAELYRQLLSEGREPAEALRLAQVSVRARPGWEAPYYWAGFVLLDGWR